MMYDNRHHEFLTQYNHKLFCHANRWGNDVIAYISELRPKVIKFLDPNLDNVKRVRELVPDGLLIYRKWKPEQPLGNSESEAFQLGVNFGQEIASEEIVRQGLVDLVEGYNEILGETAPAEEHWKFARFQLGFQEGLGDAPVEPIAFNFGTGNMSAELIMDYYGEVLSEYKWLGFHEYDWPLLNRLHLLGLAEGNGGMWLALRYRRIMGPIIAALGDNWSIVISECGMTQGVLGGQDVGFLHPKNTIQGEWSNYPTPISNDDYWATLNWYSDELMKDNYVAGACMFVTGAQTPWETFEAINTVTPKIADFQRTISNGGEMQNPYLTRLLDVRPENHQSLGVIPRFMSGDYDRLQHHWKFEILFSQGYERAQPGQLFWGIDAIEIKSGPDTLQPQVRDLNDNLYVIPPGILMFQHFTTAPIIDFDADPKYFDRAIVGFTEGDGSIGWGFGGQSWINAAEPESHNGGPLSVWASSHPTDFQPPQDRVVGSDCLSKIGWWDEHIILNPIFRIMRKSGNPPPSGQSRLVVYDQAGNEVGYTPLLTGNGSGGRIALVVDGQELSSAKLE